MNDYIITLDNNHRTQISIMNAASVAEAIERLRNMGIDTAIYTIDSTESK